MLKLGAIIVSSLLFASVPSAFAEDWTAERLQGQVEKFVDGAWMPLARGDTIPNAAKIRTTSGARVELQRGGESITLGGSTEIVINQAETHRMTRIVQVLGTVSVEAEKRNVQHFSVQTPVMVAIVKGTQFTVTYRNGLASVDVDEGVVEVRDFVTNTSVDLHPGQSAAASQMRPVRVSGPGSEDVIYVIDGKAVAAAAREAALERQANKSLPVTANARGVENRANAQNENPGQNSHGGEGASGGRNEAANNPGAPSQNGNGNNKPSDGQGGQGNNGMERP
ncbi:FecR family protein [uncultured Devosia sp.]|uniref:FecR family protein n=1 Tax=uncultured Devosia sp. TaxID=211434 RepID=UPI0026074094|nr:FecR family protein [uncultured Devosia sp.]